jgi:heat-inducible transcriptional repressor
MATRELTERKAAILRALVQLYIRSGEPVGSEAVSAASSLGVSSATIRNELAALEELGYLSQPHTSAGRVPTDRGYRVFVDALPARTRLREVERLAIVHFFDEALADVDEILRGTTQLLSRLTRYASLALAPNEQETAVARAELIPLGTSTLMLIVMENGRVEKRLVDLPGEPSNEDLETLSRELEQATFGHTVAEAHDALLGRAREVSGARAEELVRVAEVLASVEESTEADHVFMSGVANIAAEEAFRRRETLRSVYEALERESEVLRLLRQAAATGGVGVTIGHENPVEEMWEASVVTAPFGAAGLSVGTIGVIGPTRMDYGAAIAAVRAVADRLSAAVEALAR